MDMDKHTPETEIRKAFRNASLKYHPDKNKSPEAYDIYINLNNDMQILKDPEMRQNYDYYSIRDQIKIDKPTAQGKTQEEYESELQQVKIINSISCVPFYLAWFFISLAYLSKNRRKTKLALILLISSIAAIELTFMIQYMDQRYASIIEMLMPSRWTYKETFTFFRLIIPDIIALVIALFELFVYKGQGEDDEDEEVFYKHNVSEQINIGKNIIQKQRSFINYLNSADTKPTNDLKRQIYDQNLDILKEFKKLTGIEKDLTKKKSAWTFKGFIKFLFLGSFVIGMFTQSTAEITTTIKE